MSIEAIQIKSREQWLGLRSRDITASIAGALLGTHPYATAFSTWALKSGRVTDDPEVTPAMERGTILEAPAFTLLKRDHPELNVRWNGTPGEVDGEYFRDPEARIGATPDAFAEDARGKAVIQVKSVESSIFRRKWKDPDTGVVTPPLFVAIQAIMEAHLTGAKWAAVAPLVIGFGIEMPLIEVPIHKGIIDKVKTAVAEFWQMVDSGAQPNADFGRDGEIIAAMYEFEDGSEIDLTGDNVLPALRDEDAKLSGQIKQLTGRRGEIKTELLHKIGAAEVVIVDGEVFATAKTIRRKAYAVAPTTYRSVKFKKAVGSIEIIE